MPAKSKKQQMAAGIAYGAKKGDIPSSKLQGASKEMYESMGDKDLGEYARTKHKGLPAKKKVASYYDSLGANAKCPFRVGGHNTNTDEYLRQRKKEAAVPVAVTAALEALRKEAQPLGPKAMGVQGLLSPGKGLKALAAPIRPLAAPTTPTAPPGTTQLLQPSLSLGRGLPGAGGQVAGPPDAAANNMNWLRQVMAGGARAGT